MIKHILTDIEGTTTSIDFVHNTLFSISYDRMDSFIYNNFNQPLIATEIENLSKEIQGSMVSAGTISSLLKQWIKADKKETNLKNIQGKIWKEAFETKSIQGHIYKDVPELFKIWQTKGILISIFSSGSIEAQKLLYKYSSEGDLSNYIYKYFDTSIGAKRQKESYAKIAIELNCNHNEILFLSDIEEELNAATHEGLKTFLIDRDNTKKKSISIPDSY